MRLNVGALLACFLTGLFGSTAAEASGTYPPAPPRLQAEIAQKIDSVAYNLGKSIYTRGNATSADTAPSIGRDSALREHLASVIDQIPLRAREKLNVDALAASLDSAGASALIYYLRLRFHLPEATS